MQVVAGLEICTSDNANKHYILHYCTLLLTSWLNPVTSPTVQSTDEQCTELCRLGHFGTLLLFYNLFCWPLFFVLCFCPHH